MSFNVTGLFTYIYDVCSKTFTRKSMTYLEFLNDERLLVRMNKEVIDVESYFFTEGFDKHPGGSTVLYMRNKRDISEDYKFHSHKSKKKIKSYSIGYISDSIQKELDIEYGLKQ